MLAWAFGAVRGAAVAMSERRILPPGPVPVTAARSTPAAVAWRRTRGDAGLGRGAAGSVAWSVACWVVCWGAVASRTSAVMMRPFGPVPVSWVMSTPRSRATRRALGEENRRCVVCTASAVWAPGGVAAGAPGGARGRGSGRGFAGFQEPADQGTGRELGAGLDGRVEQAGRLGLDLHVHLVGGQAQQRVARLDRGAGRDEPLLDQPVLHGQPELGDEDLDGHVSSRSARAAGRPRPRCGWRPGCRRVPEPG